MYKKFLFLISFVLVLSMAYNSYGDAVAPRPSPLWWRVVPYTQGPTSIKMAAVGALDAAGDNPVQYLFECQNIGAASSTWQTDANYTATGLTPKTTYQFRARARDSALNMTAWTSSSRAATTDACSIPPVLRLDMNWDPKNNEPNPQFGFS